MIVERLLWPVLLWRFRDPHAPHWVSRRIQKECRHVQTRFPAPYKRLAVSCIPGLAFWGLSLESQLSVGTAVFDWFIWGFALVPLLPFMGAFREKFVMLTGFFGLLLLLVVYGRMTGGVSLPVAMMLWPCGTLVLFLSPQVICGMELLVKARVACAEISDSVLASMTYHERLEMQAQDLS